MADTQLQPSCWGPARQRNVEDADLLFVALKARGTLAFTHCELHPADCTPPAANSLLDSLAQTAEGCLLPPVGRRLLA